MTILEIPEQLKWFQPLKLGFGTGMSSWKVSADEATGSIEIKSTPFFKLSTVLTSLIFGALLSGMTYSLYTDEDLIAEARPFVFWAMILFPPLTVFTFVALDIFCTVADSRLWNGHLRFRFNLLNGELFFGRENITYRREDYSKLILGCVRGTSSRDRRGNKTQIFMLVLDKNEQWNRHNFSNDAWITWRTTESGSKQFKKVADLLRPHLEFDEFVKAYSQDESAELRFMKMLLKMLMYRRFLL